MPKEPRFTERPEFTAWLKLADQLIESATKDQLAETARLLALNLAHYQIRFGELPLENFAQLMETQEIDDETARLVGCWHGKFGCRGAFGHARCSSEQSVSLVCLPCCCPSWQPLRHSQAAW